MPDFLGRSVYLTEFEKQKAPLAASPAGGAPVFISLHIGEEFAPDYPDRVRAMCARLQAGGWRILADVSEVTARQFGCIERLPSDNPTAAFRSPAKWNHFCKCPRTSPG